MVPFQMCKLEKKEDESEKNKDLAQRKFLDCVHICLLFEQ